MFKNCNLKLTFISMLLLLFACLLFTSCVVNDGIVTQVAMNEQEESFSSPSSRSIKATNDTADEALNPPAKIIGKKIQKVINSWEEFDASDMPLIAAIPEKNIYLYPVKSVKDAQVALYVGESVHYYNWLYMGGPAFILPQLQLGDYDADGKDELSAILHVGSRTGVSLRELHIVDIPEKPSNQLDNANQEYFKDYIFNDYGSQLKKAISFKTFVKAGKVMGKITTDTKTYTVNLEELQSEDYGKIKDDIYFESIVDFNSEKTN